MDLLEADLRQPDRPNWKLGEIAKKYDEPVERVMDALDAIKERRGEKSYISWDGGSG
jgi:hypothetical protein